MAFTYSEDDPRANMGGLFFSALALFLILVSFSLHSSPSMTLPAPAQRDGGCRGFETWVQDPFGLDPTDFAVIVADMGGSWAQCTGTVVLEGTCGPDVGTTCSKQVAQGLVQFDVAASVQPGYLAFFAASGVAPILIPSGGLTYTLPADAGDWNVARVIIFTDDLSTWTSEQMMWGGGKCPKPD